jgi:hypothetical protein
MIVSDHEAITRKVYEYAYGIDTRDWDLYRNIFAETVTADFSSYDGNPCITMSADEWLSGVKPLFTGLDATQHTMSNPLVDIDGDSARCRVYMQAAHFLEDWPAPEFTIGGYYDDRLVRISDEWRIMAVTLTVWWRRGDEALMAEAAQRGHKALRSD